MARTANQNALDTTALQATPPAILHDAAQSAEMTAADQAVMNFEPVLRQLGQLEGLEFTRRIADVAIAQTFENLRNAGGYKGLPYRDQNGNTRYIADIEELCEIKLGKSYRRCLDLSQNLRALGADLYEQTERLGLRNVDYKALRSLPADDQALVKKAIEEATSKADVIDLLQDIVVKHAKEKEVAQADIAAKEALLSKEKQHSERLAKENDALHERVARVQIAKPDEALLETKREFSGFAIEVQSLIIGKLRPAVQTLVDHVEQHGGIAEDVIARELGLLETMLRELRQEYSGASAEDVAAWAK